MEQNLLDISYDDLIQLLQDGQINKIQFVEANPEIYPDWEEWLQENNLEKTNGAASYYMEVKDKEIFEQEGKFLG